MSKVSPLVTVSYQSSTPKSVTWEQRSVIWSDPFSCSVQRCCQVTSNTEFYSLRNTPRNPWTTYHQVTRKAGTQEWIWVQGGITPRQQKLVKAFCPVPLSMCSSPAHVSVSSGPATNWFSPFLLHSWSTSEMVIHSFCLQRGPSWPHYTMSASICFIDVLLFLYFSIQSLRKEISPAHLFISAVP